MSRAMPFGRFVAAVAVFLQRLHHDPIQLAAQQLAQLLRRRCCGSMDVAVCAASPSVLIRVLGLGGLLLADDAEHLVVGRRCEALLVKRRGAGQQLVKQHAQRVDIAARIDVQAAHLRLLGAHVHRRADHLRESA